MDKIKVAIADDHPAILEGMRIILKSDPRFSVEACFQNSIEVLKFLEENEISILVLDIDMPGAENFKLLKTIKENHPKIKVVIYTMHEGYDYFLEAKKNNANGYVLKTETITFMPTVLIKVFKGEFYCSEELEIHLSKEGKKQILKPKEKAILCYIARGFNYVEVGKALGISEKTVEYYIYSLRKKYNSNTNAELLLRLSNEIILKEV